MKTWFGNPLSAFENGVQLDLRVKLAVDFLKTPNLIPVYGKSDSTRYAPEQGPKEKAAYALELATELINQAEDLGLIKELPDTDELAAPVRKHFLRIARAQVVQQLSGQKIAQEETEGQLQRVPGSVVINGRQ